MDGPRENEANTCRMRFVVLKPVGIPMFSGIVANIGTHFCVLRKNIAQAPAHISTPNEK